MRAEDLVQVLLGWLFLSHEKLSNPSLAKLKWDSVP